MNRFQQIILALNDSLISYVVVGGVATNLHGHSRMTLDLDLIVDFAPENLTRLQSTMKSLGFVPRIPADPAHLADPAVRKSWQERNMVVYSFVCLATSPMIIDIFIEHPIPYADLLKGSVMTDFAGIPIRICSVAHLIYLKEIANRSKDQEDIQALRAIHDQRSDPT